MNCYYTGTDSKGDFEDIANTITNCFVLKGKTPTLDGMQEGTETEITAALKRVKGWDTTGTLPTLTNTRMPADLTVYKPGAGNTEPTEPKPTDPKPTDPQPTEPKPTEPKPTEPQPTEPQPTDPQPTDPQPTDPQPTDPQPTDPQPTDPQPTDPQPTDPQPTDPKPTEPKPTEPQPTEPKPTEPKPTEPKPTDPKPTDPQPTEPEEEKIISIDDLLKILDGLPIAENVTLENKKDIQQAYAAAPVYFDTEEIEPAQYKHIVDCFKALEVLIVGDLGTKLDELPEAEQITEEHRTAVEEILVDYNFLDEEYQGYIAEELRTKLEQIVAALEKLPQEPQAPEVPAPAYTTTELTALIVLVVIITLNVVTNVLLTVTIYKKQRKDKT